MKKFITLLFLAFSLSGAAQVKLDTISVQYYGIDAKVHDGSIICNTLITKKLERIFSKLLEAHYVIESITPISAYGNDDERSMTANNTSCYCKRNIAGTRQPSKHALGLAIDINPLYNPCLKLKTGKVQPAAGVKYARQRESLRSIPVSIINHNDLAYKLFKAEGFIWGGDWRSVKDYQHFELP